MIENLAFILAMAAPDTACTTPYKDVLVTMPAPPKWPASARTDVKTTVQVLVAADIGPSGNFIGGYIVKSSRNTAIDEAALDAARASTYSPKVVNCKPVRGSYYFRITFDPNSAHP